MNETSARVLVIGAGPSGMATAACLRREQIAFKLIDRRGVTGGAYRHIYPETTLASPSRYTNLPGLDPEFPGEYVAAGEYRAYLDRYAAHHGLVPEQAEVLRVERQGRRFLVHSAAAETEPYDALVVATGMYDFPIRPQIPGLPEDGPAGQGSPEVLHASSWPGPQELLGRRLLLIGGATSGIELAEECCKAGLQPVTISARGGDVKIFPQRVLGRDAHDYAFLFEKLPRWVLGNFCSRRPTLPGIDLGFRAYRKQGQIVVRGEVARFEGCTAVFRDGQRQEYDVVVLATGYSFSTPFLPAAVARAKAGHPLTTQGESYSWPGLHFVGTPCARSLSSEYLRGIGLDAPETARRIRQKLS